MQNQIVHMFRIVTKSQKTNVIFFYIYSNFYFIKFKNRIFGMTIDNSSYYNRLRYDQTRFGSNPAEENKSSTGEDRLPGEYSGIMGMPATPADLVDFTKYYAAGVGGGFLVTKLTNFMCGKGDITKSPLYKLFEQLDKVLVVANKPLETISKKFKEGTGGLLAKSKTLSEGKDCFVKGADPAWSMAKSQAHGITGMAYDEVVDVAEQLMHKPELKPDLKNLDELVESFRKGEKEKIKDIIKILSENKEAIKNTNITKKAMFFIPQTKNAGKVLDNALNKVAFMSGEGSKSVIGRFLQKTGLIAGEAVGGGVVGGGLMGVFMNAMFYALALRRAAFAPDGEKTSTFMEEIAQNVGFMAFMGITAKVLYGNLGLKYLGVKNGNLKGKEAYKSAIEAYRIGGAQRNFIELADKATKGHEKGILKGIKNHFNGKEKYQKKLTESVESLFAGKDHSIKSSVVNKVDEMMKGGKSSKEILKFVQESAKANGIEAIKTKDGLKKILKAKNSEFFKGWKVILKPVKGLATFLSAGLDKIPALTRGGKFANAVKGIGGGLGIRFFLFMGISSLFTDPIMKLCHGIFGTPTNSPYSNKNKEKNKNATGTPAEDVGPRGLAGLADQGAEKITSSPEAIRNLFRQNRIQPSNIVDQVENQAKNGLKRIAMEEPDTTENSQLYADAGASPNPMPMMQPENVPDPGIMSLMKKSEDTENYATEVLNG